MAGRFHRGGARGTTAPCAVRRPFQSRTVTGDKLALFGLQIRDFPRPITLAAASQRQQLTLACFPKSDIPTSVLLALLAAPPAQQPQRLLPQPPTG